MDHKVGILYESVPLTASYTRFVLITVDLPYEHDDPNESSSGSGNDDGGSLAGKLSAIVLSIIFSFRSLLQNWSIIRSSGSRTALAS